MLELIPWLSKHDPKKPAIFDCNAHPEKMCGWSAEFRAQMHCGWMDRSDWAGEKPAFDKPWIGDALDASARVDISDLNVCPGWAVRQSFASDALEAFSAYEKGQLATFFPGRENLVMEAVMALAQAYGTHQLVQLRKT